MKLTELLRRTEGKNLEFKRDLSSPTGFLRTVVAFANTTGGVILVGVEDRTRHIRGVTDPLDLEERVVNLVSDSIKPRLLPDVELLSYRNSHVLAVEVFPSPARPHYLAREGLHRGTYARVGSSNRLADAALVAEMRRYTTGESFDEGPLPALNSEAVDFQAASSSFAPARTLTPNNLHTLRLLTPHQGSMVPTVGGILLFGVDRLAHFPDAWIQAGRFAGVDKATIVDHLDIKTPLVQAIEDAVAFVQKHALHGIEIGQVRHQGRWSVPIVAIREAIINAVAHADYSQRGAPIRLAIFDNRIEVENPGLLPFGLTLDDLPQGISKLRNRTIGRVFHELGLVEQWGSGVQRMIATCREAGLAPPVWEEVGLRLRATIHTIAAKRGDGTPIVAEAELGAATGYVLDPTDQSILALLKDGGEYGSAQVAKAVGLTPRTTRTRLARLVSRGLVREVGTGPHDPKRRYIASRAVLGGG
ncbi:MAG: helix-turn-helix domain-containing protein [Spirochaetaceae bacterium]|nr:helix-turn-helix domain-containing protein [Spirochaetaceae bacterium]